MKAADFLNYYSEHFDTVEVDSTFYRTPSPSTVRGWSQRTPAGFIFSAKVPQVITHEKVLVNCDAEFQEFVGAMDILGDKLGVMVFQFPQFNRAAFKTADEFLVRLKPFLQRLPQDYKFAVEIRNKTWLTADFVNLLRQFRVALVLQDHSWMLHPNELYSRFDPITTDWTYIRWLGDRTAIESIAKTWDNVVIDRTNELTSWVDFCYQTQKRGVTTYGYVNNHYAGYSPATVEVFRSLWAAKGLPELARPQRTLQKFSLFEAE